jgi:hypothetical protein
LNFSLYQPFTNKHRRIANRDMQKRSTKWACLKLVEIESSVESLSRNSGLSKNETGLNPI